MLEALKISPNEAKEWLEKETSTIFIPVHEKAENLLDEMKRVLENVKDICRILMENSRKEIEKRNKKTYGKARALNKLAKLFVKRIRQIQAPDKVSYDSFQGFVQETGNAFAITEVDIKNWFPRISPFFIMDRRKFLGVFEKGKESLEELQSFLTKEYAKTKTLEETFELIDNVLMLEGQLADLEAHRKKKETEKASIERRMAETEQKVMDLKNRDNLAQLSQVNMKIEELRKEVKHNLRHLRKPFIKFRSRVLRKGGLTRDELEKLNRYIENAFDAFATEETGYPTLKQILEKLADLMSGGKLKLKRDRKRKAEQDINRILDENSLDTLFEKSREALTRRSQLSTSAETTKIKRDLLKLREELKRTTKKRKRAESEENDAKRKLEETLERINGQKKQIERNVFDFMGREIIIN